MDFSLFELAAFALIFVWAAAEVGLSLRSGQALRFLGPWRVERRRQPLVFWIWIALVALFGARFAVMAGATLLSGGAAFR